MTDFERQNQDKFDNFERQDFTSVEGSAHGRPAYDTEGRHPEQIEREIEQTRERMSRDIDALGERLSPRNLAHDAMDSVAQRARRTGTRFIDFVRENPLPVAAVGIGVTWFMTQRSKSPVSGDRMARYAYSGPERRSTGFRERVGEAASHARDAVSHAAGSAAERAGELGSGAMSHVQELGSGAKSRMRNLGTAARARAHDLGTSARTQAAENPLAVAAGAAIIGLALGFLLPETRRENQVMGGTRDRLADRAGDAAHRVADATADAADEVKNTLKTELADRAPQVKGMAQDMARRVVDQAKDAAGRVKEQAKNV
jgi:ElaB/YqjD/DUF883 family membrane-anchored ribosome-binding protein